jgi:uncharacterized protein (DUF1684 family)
MSPDDVFTLLDWKRRILALYAEVRSASHAGHAWRRWRRARDDLFRSHPQSPLPENERRAFRGLPYFDYDPALRIEAELSPAEPEHFDIPTSGEEPMAITRVARAGFVLDRDQATLDVYWLEGYGGGLFLPFRDATSGKTTYGAGRYVLDTIKGADLGMAGDRLVVDFNVAYNPSCAYDPRWVCPLAPPANRLEAAVRAGEQKTDTPPEPGPPGEGPGSRQGSAR